MIIYGIIYKITNKINGKIYIGKTTQSLSSRLKGHLNFRSNCFYIGATLKKYGIDNFLIEEIYNSFTKNDLSEKEEYFINYFNSLTPNGYNLILGNKVLKNSEAHKKLIQSAKKIEGWARTSPVIAYNIYTHKSMYFPRIVDAIKKTGLTKSIIEKNISFNRISNGYIFSHANQSGSGLINIQSHAQRLGDETNKMEYNSPTSVRIPRLYEFSKFEIEYICELYKNKSYREVAKIVGLEPSRCNRLLRKWGVIRNQEQGTKFRDSRRNMR